MTAKMPPLDVLRTFLAVYRSGSFTSAAERLQVTQPTVTNHVAQLERFLGRTLFIRVKKGSEPTPVADEIVGVLGENIDHIERYFYGEQLGDEGLKALHVGGPQEFITEFLLAALESSNSTLPKLHFTFDLSAPLVDMLCSGSLDLAILTTRPHKKELKLWPLIDEEFVLVGNPKFSACKNSRKNEWVREVPFVSFADSLPLIRRYWKTVYGDTPKMEPVITLPNLLSVKSAVCHGMGVTVLPEYLVSNELKTGELILLDSPPFAPLNTLYLAAPITLLNKSPFVLKSANMLKSVIVGNCDFFR